MSDSLIEKLIAAVIFVSGIFMGGYFIGHKVPEPRQITIPIKITSDMCHETTEITDGKAKIGASVFIWDSGDIIASFNGNSCKEIIDRWGK